MRARYPPPDMLRAGGRAGAAAWRPPRPGREVAIAAGPSANWRLADAPDPAFRGEAARSREGRAHPRPGACEHRSGGDGAVGAMSVLGTERHDQRHPSCASPGAGQAGQRADAGLSIPLPRTLHPRWQATVRRLMAEIMGLNIGYLRRSRRLDAYALRRRRHPRHQRHRGRQPAACGRLCARRQAARPRPASRSPSSATAR